jgi:hypothetical protein
MKFITVLCLALMSVNSAFAITFEGLVKLNKTVAIVNVETEQAKNGYILDEIKSFSINENNDETLLLTYKKSDSASYRIFKVHAMGFNDGSTYPAVSVTELKF